MIKSSQKFWVVYVCYRIISEQCELYSQWTFAFFKNKAEDNCLLKTSLKIFKHYKLKPSFSIIKDDKAKDRAGVAGGGQAPTPKFRQIN